jgi:hypothetical protein
VVEHGHQEVTAAPLIVDYQDGRDVGAPRVGPSLRDQINRGSLAARQVIDRVMTAPTPDEPAYHGWIDH